MLISVLDFKYGIGFSMWITNIETNCVYFNRDIIWKKDSPSSASIYSANIFLFKVSNGNTRKRCEVYSKLTIKALERRQGHISHLLLVFLYLTLKW